VGGVQELCGAVSKRDAEDVPGMTQYRERIATIAGNLVRNPGIADFSSDTRLRIFFVIINGCP
jgi:hypothetical protein